MQVTRKGSIRNRQLNHQRIPNIITQCVGHRSAVPTGQSADEGSSRLTKYADTTTKHEQAAAQPNRIHSMKGN